MKPEEILETRIAGFMQREFPLQPFRFDLVDNIGLHNGKRYKMLHGARWSTGYPDMFIPFPTKRYHGLYLELKEGKTIPNTEHTRDQARYHRVLRKLGYKCDFCLGYEDCVRKIKKHLKNYATMWNEN